MSDSETGTLNHLTVDIAMYLYCKPARRLVYLQRAGARIADPPGPPGPPPGAKPAKGGSTQFVPLQPGCPPSEPRGGRWTSATRGGLKATARSRWTCTEELAREGQALGLVRHSQLSEAELPRQLAECQGLLQSHALCHVPKQFQSYFLKNYPEINTMVTIKNLPRINSLIPQKKEKTTPNTFIS